MPARQAKVPLCKDCGGTGICEHGRQKAWCRDCGVNTGELAAHYSEKRKGYKRVYRLRQKEKERRASSRSPSPEDGAEAADRGEQGRHRHRRRIRHRHRSRSRSSLQARARPRGEHPHRHPRVHHAQRDRGRGAPRGPDRLARATRRRLGRTPRTRLVEPFTRRGDSGATSTAVHHRPDEHPAGSSDSHEHDGAADLVAQINAWTAVTNSSDDGAGSPGGARGSRVSREPPPRDSWRSSVRRRRTSRSRGSSPRSPCRRRRRRRRPPRRLNTTARASHASAPPRKSCRRPRPNSSRRRPSTSRTRPSGCRCASRRGFWTACTCADAVDGFSGYRHELPHGLEADARPRDWRQARLRPDGGGEARGADARGGTGRQIWMTYEHLGLKVDLAAVDWEDGDAPRDGSLHLGRGLGRIFLFVARRVN